MEFRSAGCLDEALDLLDAHGAEVALLAGGTDLMMQLQRREVAPRILVHLERIRDLGSITPGHAPAIGALATHRAIAGSPVLCARHGAICAAAASVGGWQTQAVGTIGGNLCNASPAADTAAPLLVHGAAVCLASRRHGERVMPLERFLLGRRRVERRPEEILTGIILEPMPGNSADVYVKVGRRQAMEIAIAGVAVRLTLATDGRAVLGARIATCALGPVPARAHDVERALQGQPVTQEVLRAAGQMLAAAIDPIDDARASARYRRAVVSRVLADALQKCAASVRSATIEQ